MTKKIQLAHIQAMAEGLRPKLIRSLGKPCPADMPVEAIKRALLEKITGISGEALDKEIQAILERRDFPHLREVLLPTAYPPKLYEPDRNPSLKLDEIYKDLIEKDKKIAQAQKEQFQLSQELAQLGHAAQEYTDNQMLDLVVAHLDQTSVERVGQLIQRTDHDHKAVMIAVCHEVLGFTKTLELLAPVPSEILQASKDKEYASLLFLACKHLPREVSQSLNDKLNGFTDPRRTVLHTLTQFLGKDNLLSLLDPNHKKETVMQNHEEHLTIAWKVGKKEFEKQIPISRCREIRNLRIPLDAKVIWPGKSSHPLVEALQIFAPSGIVIYGACRETNTVKDGGGNEFPYAFDGLKVITIPLWKWWVRDENGNPVLEKFSRMTDDEARIYSQGLAYLLDHPTTVGAYVNQGKIILWHDPQARGWLWWLEEKGITAGGKNVTKRMKSLLSGHTRVKTLPPAEVKVKLLNTEKALLDGCVFIRRSFLVKCLAGYIEESTHDLARRVQRHEMMIQARKFTLRVGLPEIGFLKGLAYVISDRQMKKMAGEDVDILTHPENIKSEITFQKEVVVMLTPHRKYSRTYTATMAALNLREVFSEERMKLWIDSYLMELKDRIVTGQVEESVEELLQETVDMEDEMEFSPYLVRRTQVMDLVEAGAHLYNSPTILKGYFKSRTESLIKEDSDKTRIPIPCARFVPVISKTVARVLGDLTTVPEGQCHYNKKFDVLVVSDQDWVKNLPNHGGCDLDDKFYCLWLQDHDGKTKVLVYRMPMGKGEYALYEALNLQDGPKSTVYYKSKDETVKVMEYPLQGKQYPRFDSRKLPKPLTQMIADGELKIESLPATEPYQGMYDREFVLTQFERALNGASPGYCLNIIMWAHMMNFPIKRMPCSLEDVVDTFTKGTDTRTLEYLTDWFQSLYEKMVALGVTCDRDFVHKFKKMRDKEGNLCVPQAEIQWLSRVRDYGTKRIVQTWREVFTAQKILPAKRIDGIILPTELQGLCEEAFQISLMWDRTWEECKEALVQVFQEVPLPQRPVFAARLCYDLLTQLKCNHNWKHRNDRVRSDWLVTSHYRGDVSPTEYYFAYMKKNAKPRVVTPPVVPNPGEQMVQDCVEAILQEFRNLYKMTYSPQDQDGTTVYLLSLQKDLKARRWSFGLSEYVGLYCDAQDTDDLGIPHEEFVRLVEEKVRQKVEIA